MPRRRPIPTSPTWSAPRSSANSRRPGARGGNLLQGRPLSLGPPTPTNNEQHFFASDRNVLFERMSDSDRLAEEMTRAAEAQAEKNSGKNPRRPSERERLEALADHAESESAR